MPILILNGIHVHTLILYVASRSGEKITATAHVRETTATKVVLAEPNAGPICK